jgi:hypothetical protein
MTASLTGTLRQAGLLLAVAASVSALSSTSSFAFTAEIPNIPKITACLIKHPADLSTGRRMVMDRDLAQRPSTVAAQ